MSYNFEGVGLKLLLNNIRAVFPNQEIDKYLNILIENGRVEAITNEDIHHYDEKIEGDELILVPGLSDIHVHFRTPGQTHKEDLSTGAASALNGGFTSVVCMPNTSPAIDNLLTYKYLKEEAKKEILDIYFSAAITKGRKGEELSDIYSLYDEGVLFFTDDGDPIESPSMMNRALRYAGARNIMLSQHCEEKSITRGFSIDECEASTKYGLIGYPKVAEELIIQRDILLTHYNNARYHVQHISSGGSIDLVREAKKKGINVTAEVAPHHFSFTNEIFLDKLDSNFKMNPPLRSKVDIEKIIEGLKDDTIDIIATDHAPHTDAEKSELFEETPNGIVGLETSLGVTLTYLYHKKHLSIVKIVEKMSVNPRQLVGLKEILLEKGEVANFTIIDLNTEWIVNKNKFKSKSKNTPYDGMTLKGKPVMVIKDKEIIKSNL